jgi:hypothetical protein
MTAVNHARRARWLHNLKYIIALVVAAVLAVWMVITTPEPKHVVCPAHAVSLTMAIPLCPSH